MMSANQPTLGKKFMLSGAREVGLGLMGGWVGSNNGPWISLSLPATMFDREWKREVVLFGCSIALIQYSIMRWSAAVSRWLHGCSLPPPSLAITVEE